MRATVLAALFTFGVTAMSDTQTQADDKKETKVKITVRSWDNQGKQFLKPQEGVDARRVEAKGLVAFFVPTRQAIGRGQPTRGSEITDVDGTVYEVVNAYDTKSGEYQATCKKKP